MIRLDLFKLLRNTFWAHINGGLVCGTIVYWYMTDPARMEWWGWVLVMLGSMQIGWYLCYRTYMIHTMLKDSD